MKRLSIVLIMLFCWSLSASGEEEPYFAGDEDREFVELIPKKVRVCKQDSFKDFYKKSTLHKSKASATYSKCLRGVIEDYSKKYLRKDYQFSIKKLDAISDHEIDLSLELSCNKSHPYCGNMYTMQAYRDGARPYERFLKELYTGGTLISGCGVIGECEKLRKRGKAYDLLVGE